MTELVLRNATLMDIEDIMKIEKESFDINIVESEEVFRERIITYNEGFFVATINDTVIGYICSELWEFSTNINKDAFLLNHSISNFHILDGNELYISSMGLLKKYRGFGYGSKMFNYLIDRNKSNKKIISVILLVSYEFKKAKLMYENQGFKKLFEVDSVFAFNDSSIQNGLAMRKLL